jgi:hypothetical protein
MIAKSIFVALLLFLVVSAEKPIEERVSQLEADQITQYKELINLIKDNTAQLETRVTLRGVSKTAFLTSGIFKFVIACTVLWIIVLLLILFRTRRIAVIETEEKPLKFLRLDSKPNPQLAVFLNCILPGISYFMIQQFEKGSLIIVRSVINIAFIVLFSLPVFNMLESEQDLLLFAITGMILSCFMINHLIHMVLTSIDVLYIFERVCKGYPILAGECLNKYVKLGVGEFVFAMDVHSPHPKWIEEMQKHETE